jgi:hypothetical protein
MHVEGIVIRPARPDDAVVLRRLAHLDSARPPRGPALLAEAGGRAVAALDLSDGRMVADPFTPTLDLRALLELRARQLPRAA